MQTVSEIRRLLTQANLRPRRRLGQSFLIDRGLFEKLLALAELGGNETVLEVGPGTGSLTEELLTRCARVVAVEIDTGLARVVRARLGDRENLLLITGDVLSSKHAIAPEVLTALGSRADLVANLPYSIATPLLGELLVTTHRAITDGESSPLPRFGHVTVTVQKEVADRLSATCGDSSYGPISILVNLLSTIRLGPVLPPGVFYPVPKVSSRMLRIDVHAESMQRIVDVDVLQGVLRLGFGQRRKQIGSILRRKGSPFAPELLREGLRAAGIDLTVRAQRVTGEQFAAMANFLVREGQ